MLILRNYKANPRVTTQNNTLSAPPPKTTPQVPSLHGQYVLLFSLISSSKNPFLNCSVGVSGSVKFVPCSVWLPLLDIILRIALLHEKKKQHPKRSPSAVGCSFAWLCPKVIAPRPLLTGVGWFSISGSMNNSAVNILVLEEM